jgi:hypothetical protein
LLATHLPLGATVVLRYLADEHDEFGREPAIVQWIGAGIRP